MRRFSHQQIEMGTWERNYVIVRLQTIRDTLVSELGYRIGFLSQVDVLASC